MLPPARTVPIAETTTGSLLVGGASVLTFYGFTEQTGAADAHVQLYDGSSNLGALIVDVTLNQGESTRDLIPRPCLYVRGDLWFEVVSGTVAGSVWVVPLERIAAYAAAQGIAPFWAGDE